MPYIEHRFDSRLYSIWRGVLRRCNDKKCVNYRYYGGKGVQVEFTSWHDFRDWAIENGYQANLTIDRIDPEGNYSKSNCQWITQSENSKKSAIYHGHNTYEGTKKERKYQQDKFYREKSKESLKEKKHLYYVNNLSRIKEKSKLYRNIPSVKKAKQEYDKQRRERRKKENELIQHRNGIIHVNIGPFMREGKMF